MSLATLSAASSPDCPPRFGTSRNRKRLTHGGRVADLAESLGFPLMPWQRHVLDVALEVDRKTGRLVYRRVVLTVPRQSGKTTLLLALFAHRALGFDGPQVMTYAAQTGVDARKKFIDEHIPILERSPLSPMFRKRLTNGHEAVLWKNGSRHHISAGTEKSGHGATLDLAVIDEAFAQPDGRLEQAFSPAMVTRQSAQLWFVSTAGKPSDEWFRDKVEAGRDAADVQDGTAYFEWSAPDDADPNDPNVWRACMPALGHTITEETITAELAGMPLDEFRRAYLNQWVRKGHEQIIDGDLWSSLADPASQIDGRLTFSVEIPSDRSCAAVGVAGLRADGRPHVEVAEKTRGTDWVLPWLLERALKHRADVAIDGSSEAAGLIPALEAAAVKVRRVGGGERAQACGSFYDAAIQRNLAHLDDSELNTALAAAAWKVSAEGARSFSRKVAGTDISSLYAVTFALWGFQMGQFGTYDPADSVW